MKKSDKNIEKKVSVMSKGEKIVRLPKALCDICKVNNNTVFELFVKNGLLTLKQKGSNND